MVGSRGVCARTNRVKMNVTSISQQQEAWTHKCVASKKRRISNAGMLVSTNIESGSMEPGSECKVVSTIHLFIGANTCYSIYRSAWLTIPRSEQSFLVSIKVEREARGQIVQCRKLLYLTKLQCTWVCEVTSNHEILPYVLAYSRISLLESLIAMPSSGYTTEDRSEGCTSPCC